MSKDKWWAIKEETLMGLYAHSCDNCLAGFRCPGKVKPKSRKCKRLIRRTIKEYFSRCEC